MNRHEQEQCTVYAAETAIPRYQRAWVWGVAALAILLCGLAAGWLIEAAGWKGKALGPVGMYQKQALVLVNHGGASGEDVRRGMAAVQAAVRTKFAVELTPEPVFL